MPRIDADSSELSPENGAPPSRLTFGVRFDSECRSVRFLLRKVSAVNAVMAIGTFWMFSLRFSAVTTISSSPSANATDAISVDATAAAPTAKRQRRERAGGIFPSVGFLDIPIPPMIFSCGSLILKTRRNRPRRDRTRPVYTPGVHGCFYLRANSCWSYRVISPKSPYPLAIGWPERKFRMQKAGSGYTVNYHTTDRRGFHGIVKDGSTTSCRAYECHRRGY